MIWFTADLHFGHRNILRHTDRPFSNIKEMEEYIITTWNDQVKPRQMVWVLGDFSFYGKEKTRDILSRLNGDIRIVRGNHDKHARQLVEVGFSNVYENHYIELVNHYYVNLSHFPYHPLGEVKDYDTRYLHKRMVDDGKWLLHGHTHSIEKIDLRIGKQCHVGWDAWGRLVSADEIYKLIQTQES